MTGDFHNVANPERGNAWPVQPAVHQLASGDGTPSTIYAVLCKPD